MKILDFVKKLFASFKKNDIREKIRTIKHKLSLPVMQSMETLSLDDSYKEMSLSSDYGKKFIHAWVSFLPTRSKADRNQPYLSVLRPAVVNAVNLLDQLDEYVDKQLDEVIQIEGITYQKATVLRLIELLDFFGDYAIRQLSYLVACETNITAFSKPDGRPFSKGEEAYLLGQNQVAFFRLIELLSNDPKTVLQQIVKIQDVVVLGDDDKAMMGPSKDPLRLDFIPVVPDFLLWYGERQVDLDADRLERAQKEERVIKMRLEALRQRLASGNPDARTETVIKNYERELTLKRTEISRVEDRLKGIRK